MIRICLAVCLLGTSLAQAVEIENLPGPSRKLVLKLQAFAQEEQAKSERLIEEKTIAVIRILEKQVKEATVAGNLEAAAAIHKEVLRLKKAVTPVE